jgi:hypothetical protein
LGSFIAANAGFVVFFVWRFCGENLSNKTMIVSSAIAHACFLLLCSMSFSGSLASILSQALKEASSALDWHPHSTIEQWSSSIQDNRAFANEVDIGSRQENAIKQRSRAAYADSAESESALGDRLIKAHPDSE